MTNEPEPIAPIVVLPPEGSKIARPPRAFTIGRRRSDRWLAWAGVIAFVALSLFVIMTSYRLDRAIADRTITCPAPER